MKNIFIIFLLISLMAPSLALAQQPVSNAIDVNLSETLEQFNIRPSEGNIEGLEVPDSPTNLLNMISRLLDLSGGIFGFIRGIIAQVDTFLVNTVGISVAELVKSLVVATINIMKVIIEILSSLLEMV